MNPDGTHHTLSSRPVDGMAKTAQLWVGPAPPRTNQPPPDELEQILDIAKEFDKAARDERNRALGKAGEERVLKHERDTLNSAGRQDLAKQIRWVKEENGDGAGNDITSFDADGQQCLIEVNTTKGLERRPFHDSRNEFSVENEWHDEWCLFRLWNFARTPNAFELRPPLDAHVSPTGNSFQASLH